MYVKYSILTLCWGPASILRQDSGNLPVIGCIWKEVHTIEWHIYLSPKPTEAFKDRHAAQKRSQNAYLENPPEARQRPKDERTSDR